MTRTTALTNLGATLLIGCAAATTLQAQSPQAAAKADEVAVTVTYEGKGTVDATHQLWVWLFDTPKIGPEAEPLAEQALSRNGGTATFPNVSAKQVYIAVAYDEKGGFSGQSAPPLGSPVALYGVKSLAEPPLAVVPGARGAVKLTFNDALRMQ